MPNNFGYLPSMEGDPSTLQAPRHSQIIQQYSSSTDEGCDTDHGEMDDVIQSSVPPSIQRLNSYASSSSSSGVVTNFHTKSLSQNLSCESSRSNFSTFESLDLNLSDCSDLAASLPSCATSVAIAMIENIKENGESFIFFAQIKTSLLVRLFPFSFFSFTDLLFNYSLNYLLIFSFVTLCLFIYLNYKFKFIHEFSLFRLSLVCFVFNFSHFEKTIAF